MATTHEEFLDKLEAFLDGWDFGDDEMQAQADELLEVVKAMREDQEAVAATNG